MKVLCSACEAAEARVLCCADEAALCARCDREIHAANRLAGKHHRLPLLPPAAVSAPNCDICQESHAYFFCVEDRALLCRSCDVAVHTANAFVSSHRRFLLTGVQVGLQSDAQEPETQPPHASAAAPLQTPPPPPAKKGGSSPAPLYSDDEIDWATGPDVGITGDLPDWSVVNEQFSAPVPRPAESVVIKPPPKRSPREPVAAAFAGHGSLAGGMPDWPLDEFLGFSEFNAGRGFTENGMPKADSGKLGSTHADGSPSPNGRSSSDSAQNFFGQVPEVHQWFDAAAVFVPDISSPENPFRCFAAAGQPQPAPAKRRRRC
ncbi:B-box zinc finger protein 22-like isoform X2 [Phragmites australis]|uniref:B-box zinc finger protein 22-like isoform X2 n=1 Tax=Phragmites australis TaxID=29695 RepID=UPI002D7A10B1|nr:B-box zinc finger protein 22-like isoform X2 [Phragmites australis]